MYCVECGRFFDEPNYTYDDPSDRDVSLPSGAYAYAECPYCGSDWLEESHKCEICEEDITDGQFCDDCKETLKDKLEEVKIKLKIDQSTLEDLIGEVFEW